MKKFKFVNLLSVIILLCSTFALAACGDKKNDTNKKQGYAITIASTVENGTIQTNYTSCEAGTVVTVVVTPNEGYELEEGSLKFNNIAVSENNTFVMPAEDVLITGVFVEQTKHQIAISSTIANGTVTADKTNCYVGTKVTLTITPNEGFALLPNSLKFNDTEIVDNAFVMPNQNVLITAIFVNSTKHSITISDEIFNGIITTDKTEYLAGENVVVNVTPQQGYSLVPNSLKYNETTVVDGSFTMPAENVVLTAKFEKTFKYGMYEIKSYHINGFPQNASQAQMSSINFNDATQCVIKTAEGNKTVNYSLQNGQITLTGLEGEFNYSAKYTLELNKITFEETVNEEVHILVYELNKSVVIGTFYFTTFKVDGFVQNLSSEERMKYPQYFNFNEDGTCVIALDNTANYCLNYEFDGTNITFENHGNILVTKIDNEIHVTEEKGGSVQTIIYAMQESFNVKPGLYNVSKFTIEGAEQELGNLANASIRIASDLQTVTFYNMYVEYEEVTATVKRYSNLLYAETLVSGMPEAEFTSKSFFVTEGGLEIRGYMYDENQFLGYSVVSLIKN